MEIKDDSILGYYAGQVQKERKDTLIEVINKVVDLQNSCFGNDLMRQGYKLAKTDLIKILKDMK